MPRCIDPLAQEAMLEALPDDAAQAREVLAQFTANILDSQNFNPEEFFTMVRTHYRAYKGNDLNA